MNRLNRFLILLFFPFTQVITAQYRPHQLKTGFEERIHRVVYSVRLIDTHEHLMSEKDALAGASDFSCLFTNYQQSDLISSGAASEKIYNRFKGKDADPDEKWSLIKDAWANVRTTAYGRSVLIAANDLYGIDDLNEHTFLELSKRIKEAHKSGYYQKILTEKYKVPVQIHTGLQTGNGNDISNANPILER